jgi:hypothetical protein
LGILESENEKKKNRRKASKIPRSLETSLLSKKDVVIPLYSGTDRITPHPPKKKNEIKRREKMGRWKKKKK